MATLVDLVKVLSDKEEKLVCVLSEKDPVEVAKNLYRKCVISDTMRDNFTSLDHSRLEPQLQIRYLLRLVCKRLEEDNTVWSKFLNLLTSMGTKFNTVKKELQDLLNKIQSNPQVPEEVGDTDTILTSADGDDLLEYLADKCYKWEEIAVALKLSKSVIEECRSKTTNILRLNEVLTQWLSGTSSTTTSLNTLKKALCGKIVREHEVGMALVEQITPVIRARLTVPTQTTDNDGSNSNPTINCQSDDTEVADGMSSLLFCQASSRQSVCYQWKRNGQFLSNSSTYSGVTNDILVINHARQGTEGEYTCHVSSEGKEVCSNKIILSVHYPPIKKRLLDLYSVTTEVPSDSWPPAGTKTFINLVLIKSSKEPTDITDYSVSCNPDKITAARQKVEYQQVFGKCTAGELILLEGRPGSGKTTLVHKLIKDWTLGHVLVDARWVMLITLRDLNNTTAETLTDILKMFCHSDQIVSPTIEGESGEGLCFIIDGLDEYQSQDKEKSPIYQLLNKTLLPKAMVIVSSRPSATRHLKKDMLTKRIEVFGFNKNQIFEYIDSFPFDSNSSDSDTNNTSCTSPAKLKKYLLTHPNIFNLCYLPVNAAMICYLFKCCGRIPIIRTKLYEEFTRSIILRHLTRHNAGTQLESLQDLSGEYKTRFLAICHVAFKMTVTSKQTISSQDINMEQPEDEETKFLGLITIGRTARLSGFHTTYTFLHLTFQEFFAAYHISILATKDQLKIIDDYRYGRESMWSFYCGLTDFSREVEKLKLLISPFDLPIHLVFESQQPALVDYVLNNTIGFSPGELRISELTPQYITEFDYFLSHASTPFNSVYIHPFTHQDEDYLELLKTLENHKEKLNHVKKLDIDNLPLNEAHMIVLANILNTSTKFTTSKFRLNNNIDPGGMNILSNTLDSLPLLESLTLNCISRKANSSKADDITALINSFKHLKHTQLILQLNDLDTSAVEELGRQLQQVGNNRIYDIKLINSSIDTGSAAALAAGLPRLTELTKLHLVHNNIGDDEVHEITHGLAHLKKLRSLQITNNKNLIGSSGMTSLVGGTLCLPCLEGLDLSNNNIGPEGAAALAAALQHHTRLKELYLRCNNIGPEGAMSLASELHHLKQLYILHLSGNNIDVAGASHVITATKNCTNLLQINFNKDGSKHMLKFSTIYVIGVVSADDSDAIATLVAAAQQHNSLLQYLDLGFINIEVKPYRSPTNKTQFHSFPISFLK